MATKTIKATANTGASIERSKLLAKIRRLVAAFNAQRRWDAGDGLNELAEWVKGSAERASAKIGGLGKK